MEAGAEQPEGTEGSPGGNTAKLPQIYSCYNFIQTLNHKPPIG